MAPLPRKDEVGPVTAFCKPLRKPVTAVNLLAVNLIGGVADGY
ncbi:hypothetical protein [Beijerinckia sp. L45]|nr:hypothetical protein [Beijerinckia sp. L45]